jgi:Holliday junction DNA helicase RuvA
MIREVRGTVLSVEDGSAVVDVSGFGVQVHLSSTAGVLEGAVVSYKTYMCIRQDGVELFGFPDEAERRFFEQLLTVPGVGPKTALGILRKAPREALEGAIGSRNIDYLTRVAGLGKKAAEKLMVELSGKVGGAAPAESDAEVFDTLVALGYTAREARGALARIGADVEGKDARLKAALSAAR